MKKTISLILALVMCLSLCACAKSPEELIIGTWEGEVGNGQNGYFTFEENGHFSSKFGDIYTENGEYTITEDTLTVSWLENGVHPATYEFDLISLTEDTLSFSLSEGDDIRTCTLYRKKSVNYNSSDTTHPKKLIVGTWEGQDGFFTFLENGHFTCDFVDAVVGDGTYTITEDTLTVSWERNGGQKCLRMTLITLTEDTLSFSDSQRTYVLHKS